MPVPDLAVPATVTMNKQIQGLTMIRRSMAGRIHVCDIYLELSLKSPCLHPAFGLAFTPFPYPPPSVVSAK